MANKKDDLTKGLNNTGDAIKAIGSLVTTVATVMGAIIKVLNKDK